MILDVSLWAIISALITGRLKGITKIHLRYVYLFPIPLVLQIVPFHREIFIPASFFLLAFLIFSNRDVKGFGWIGWGLILNGLVMSLNTGRMPVLEDLAIKMGLKVGERHILTGWNPFLILGDWIPVWLPYGRRFLISPGDVLVYIGVFIFFLSKEKVRSERMI